MPTSVFLDLNNSEQFSGQMVGPSADNTSAPPFTFLGDLDTGLGSSAAGTVDLMADGTAAVAATSTTVKVATALGIGASSSPDTNHPFSLRATVAGQVQALVENLSTNAAAYTEFQVKNGTTSSYVAAINQGASAGPFGANRSYIDTASVSGSGWDYSANHSTGNHRFYTGGYTSGQQRLLIDSTGLTITNNGALIWGTDNGADIGAAAATRPRTAYIGTSIDLAGSKLVAGSSGTVTKYNNVTTAGVGVPSIVAAGRVTAQSAANASIATYTVGAADGSFAVSGNLNATVVTTLVTTLTCTYTDESSTARTMVLPVTQLSGSFIAAGAITGTGAWETPVMHIRCKASTAITILTSAGTFTNVVYSAEGIIRWLA